MQNRKRGEINIYPCGKEMHQPKIYGTLLGKNESGFRYSHTIRFAQRGTPERPRRSCGLLVQKYGGSQDRRDRFQTIANFW